MECGFQERQLCCTEREDRRLAPRGFTRHFAAVSGCAEVQSKHQEATLHVAHARLSVTPCTGRFRHDLRNGRSAIFIVEMSDYQRNTASLPVRDGGLSAWSDNALIFIKQISRCSTNTNGEQLETTYLLRSQTSKSKMIIQYT
jgi:hypothetical protein